MLNELYNLAEQYNEKKVYIWGTNRNSMEIFAKFANKRVSVQGFITEKEKFVGEIIMNRPVVSVGAVETEKDILVVVADREKVSAVSVNFAVNTLPWIIAYEDCLSVDYRIKNKKKFFMVWEEEAER